MISAGKGERENEMDFYQEGILSRTWEFEETYSKCKHILLTQCREYGEDKLLDHKLQEETLKLLKTEFEKWIKAFDIYK